MLLASIQRLQVFETANPSWTTLNNLMNSQPSENHPAQAAPSNAAVTSDYVTEEIARRAADDKGTDATEPYCDNDVIDQFCKENLPQFHLPRLVRCGDGMFGITYKYTIVKGKFSLHHSWRWEDRKIFSLKLDKRNLDIVKWDQHVRSKLTGVDAPRAVHAERQENYCLTIMEPFSVSLKWYMQYLMNNTRNSDLYYGMLLRTGRQCVRYLQRVHESGFLHGNINPHTFVFPTSLINNEGKPDFDRGPLIVDYGFATNWKEDPIYKEEEPEKLRNNAIYAADGGMYTRRDDMENFGYLLLYLTKGFLRWDTRTQRDFVMFGKKCISDLHKYVKGIPLRVKQYLTYIRILKWNEAPDYDLLDDILSDKKVDIRQEIKIRRGRRAAEKQRLRRQKRAEEKAQSSAYAVEARGKVGKTQRKRKMSKKDGKKPNIAVVDPNRGADNADPAFVYPTGKIPVPSEVETNSVSRTGDPEIEEGEPWYCSKIHQKPTKVQCLDLNTFTEEGYKEIMEYEKPHQFSAEELEVSDAEHICTRIDHRIAEVVDPCGEEGDMAEAMMIDQVINDQLELPDRQLGDPRTELKISSAMHQLMGYQKSGYNIQFMFPLLLWENDVKMQHPWEDFLGYLARAGPHFEIKSLNDPAPSGDLLIDPSKLDPLYL